MRTILILSMLVISKYIAATEVNAVDKSDGFYIGAGVEFPRFTNQSERLLERDGDNNITGDPINIQNRKINKVGGVFAVGYGRCVINRFYVGGELSLDISDSTLYKDVYKHPSPSGYDVYYGGKLHGVIPSAVIRLGLRFSSSTMVYVRGGGAYIRADFYDGTGTASIFTNLGYRASSYGSEISVSKVVPVVGLGVEQQVCGHLSLRLEGDYRFNSKKTSTESIKAIHRTSPPLFVELGLRNCVKNYTVRVMGIYKF